MENIRNTKTDTLKHLIIAGSIIIAVYILANAFLSRNKENEVIQVTGLGTKDFESDLIVWSGSYSQMNNDLKNAYAKLYADQNQIIEFLRIRNVPEKDYVFSAVTIDKKYDTLIDKNNNRLSVFKGYILNQELKIESKEIEKIEKVSREISELINMGVEFCSYKPQYYYTKLSELKKELIEHATENAKERASSIAVNSGFKLGRLKNANMGVFQIIARNSNDDYSWGGTFNTDSKQKTATITMKLQFGIK